MSITYQTVLGEDGEPTAAIIPWEEFSFASRRNWEKTRQEASGKTSLTVAQKNWTRAK
ncbi:MAG: hypothetical protein ACKVHP_03860 [Verrucomicrobiales bacterium]